MIGTAALSPHLGVEVTGVDGKFDDVLVSRCQEALKWRGVLLVRGLRFDETPGSRSAP